jgi:tRNA-dihydrouridine synthase B
MLNKNIKLILAPMAGFADHPFRRVCRRFGADEVVTELLSANALVRDNRKTMKMTELHPEEIPASMQIFGADPDVMAEAARIVEQPGSPFIDINMGCPVKKVVKTGAGAALLDNHPLAARIVKKVVDAVKTPVSVKIRTGKSRALKSGFELALAVAESGASRITVHARTVEDRFCGPVDYDFVAELNNRLWV